MRAIEITSPGGPDVLALVERPDPVPAAGEVLVRVRATAVNRADLLQRQGRYPPPPGATDIPGLEAAGEVVAVGTSVTRWSVGDEVCAVLPGGGYAELVCVDEAVAMPLPPGLDAVAAAAVPEVWATAWDNVVRRGRLEPGESVLVHGGASGVGTAAVQLAVRRGCRAYVTAGTQERVARCVALGARGGVSYRTTEDLAAAVRALAGGGVDVVLDIVGGRYLAANLACLRDDGRLVVIGLMGGASAELDLAALLQRRLTVAGSTLRSRSAHAKAALAADLVANVWPGFADGSLRPVIDRVLPLEQAAQAHAALEDGGVFGKIVLTIG